jgi:hypothetical protein
MSFSLVSMRFALSQDQLYALGSKRFTNWPLMHLYHAQFNLYGSQSVFLCFCGERSCVLSSDLPALLTNELRKLCGWSPSPWTCSLSIRLSPFDFDFDIYFDFEFDFDFDFGFDFEFDSSGFIKVSVGWPWGY